MATVVRGLFAVASVWTCALVALLWAAVAATIVHFRRRVPRSAQLRPMTLIKPVRGLDDALEDGLRSVFDSDPGRRLQVLIAMEGPDDPAYAALERLASSQPGRDVEFVFAGPSGDRMGKIHNMIAALSRAKHPRIVFSDADASATPELLLQTSAAFDDGCDAVFALPYHPAAPGPGGYLFQVAFNHGFGVAAALSYYAGMFRFCAGAWMGYTREILERLGGLEQLAHAIADDFALSGKALAAGARPRLLRDYVTVRETGTGLREAFVHLAKWSAIGHSCLPGPYALFPLANIGLASLVAWALGEVSSQAAAGRAVLALGLGSRALAGLAQDSFAARRLMSPAAYFGLAFADLGALVFWITGFRRRIFWRGTRYRLRPGGEAEVLCAWQK